MNTTYWLQIKLQSDTAFTRGDGVPGMVNSEVQHDANGMPFLGGKTLKGLLSASCAEVISAIKQSKPQFAEKWEQSAARLFGQPGGGPAEAGCLHVGDARLPEDLIAAVSVDVKNRTINRMQVLESLTTLRSQTAMDAESGAPLRNSLRTIRVILRETVFFARVEFLPLLGGNVVSEQEQQQDLALLAACAKALRRAGANRNRGLGLIRVELFDAYPFEENAASITAQAFDPIKHDLESK